jgi:hypothetical protein
MRNRAATWALVIVTCLTACASPFVDPVTQDNESSPSKDLAARATPVEATGGATRDNRRERVADGAVQKGGPARSTEPEEAPPPDANFAVVGSLADERGDLGADPPAYADVVSVTIGDDSVRARVTVQVAGKLPVRTRRTEVQGLGVDLYRDSGDYQLFASGEPDGWFGYLYTPDGFVRYRGDFEVQVDRVIFTVPWGAIGGRGDGELSLFLDWTGPNDRFSQDLAPESGTAPFHGGP